MKTTITAQTKKEKPAKYGIGTVVSFFSTDWPFLITVFLGIGVWFLLAQLSALLIPDTMTTLRANSTQYLNYVIRNGQVYLFIVLLIGCQKLLKATHDSEKGSAAFPFLYAKAKDTLKNDKKFIFATPLYFFLAMLFFGAYLFSYSTIKTRIPNILPYTWDDTFNKLDRLIFLGRDPWQWFSFLYDYPVVIRTMDYIYDFWAAILVSCWFFSLRYGGPNKKRRYQFVIALLLTWFIGGNLFAILLSSGGPVYFDALTGLPSSYAEQMSYLSALNAQTPLRAFEYQDVLWNVYKSPSVGLGGISAMPSMHCASSLLLLFMFGRNKFMRPLLIAFCTLIFVSSFMLAWHYAVDGIFVAPIAYGCWKIAGKISEKLIKVGTIYV